MTTTEVPEEERARPANHSHLVNDGHGRKWWCELCKEREATIDRITKERDEARAAMQEAESRAFNVETTLMSWLENRVSPEAALATLEALGAVSMKTLAEERLEGTEKE